MIEKINCKELTRNTLRSDAHLSINKKLIDVLGLECSAFLSDLISKEQYFEGKNQLRNNWFFNTQENRKKDTGIPYHHQTKIVKFLSDIELLEVKREGLPSKQFFRINHEKLVYILQTEKPVIDKSIDMLLTTKKDALEQDKTMSIDNKNNSNKNNLNINKITSSKEDVKVSEETKQPLSNNSLYKENTEDTPIIEELSLIREKAKQATTRQRRQRKEQEIEKNGVTVSEEEQEIIDAWNSCGATRHGEGTKTYKEMVLSIRKLIRGTFFNSISEHRAKWKDIKFEKQDILGIIQNLSKAINSLDHEPQNKTYLKKLSFQTFLYNSYGNKESKFIQYTNPPKELKETIREKEDKYPKVTKEFMRIWYKEELGLENIPDIKGGEKNKFISSSYKMWEFYQTNKYNFAWGMDVFELCRLTYRALKESFGEGKITIGNLCSDYTYQNILPQYMERMAMWGEK